MCLFVGGIGEERLRDAAVSTVTHEHPVSGAGRKHEKKKKPAS
jgi:hypothetical protein